MGNPYSMNSYNLAFQKVEHNTINKRFDSLTDTNMFYLEHANGFVKVYEEHIDRLTDKLRGSIMRCEWNMIGFFFIVNLVDYVYR
jgi:hypothetical protein